MGLTLGSMENTYNLNIGVFFMCWCGCYCSIDDARLGVYGSGWPLTRRLFVWEEEQSGESVFLLDNIFRNREMLATLTFGDSLWHSLLLDEINVCPTTLCEFCFQCADPQWFKPIRKRVLEGMFKRKYC